MENSLENLARQRRENMKKWIEEKEERKRLMLDFALEIEKDLGFQKASFVDAYQIQFWVRNSIMILFCDGRNQYNNSLQPSKNWSVIVQISPNLKEASYFDDLKEAEQFAIDSVEKLISKIKEEWLEFRQPKKET